jgi:hypothetical protein
MKWAEYLDKKIVLMEEEGLLTNFIGIILGEIMKLPATQIDSFIDFTRKLISPLGTGIRSGISKIATDTINYIDGILDNEKIIRKISKRRIERLEKIKPYISKLEISIPYEDNPFLETSKRFEGLFLNYIYNTGEGNIGILSGATLECAILEWVELNYDKIIKGETEDKKGSTKNDFLIKKGVKNKKEVAKTKDMSYSDLKYIASWTKIPKEKLGVLDNMFICYNRAKHEPGSAEVYTSLQLIESTIELVNDLILP